MPEPITTLEEAYEEALRLTALIRQKIAEEAATKKPRFYIVAGGQPGQAFIDRAGTMNHEMRRDERGCWWWPIESKRRWQDVRDLAEFVMSLDHEPGATLSDL